jgi:DNA-binding transcriptional MerR regulator
MELKATLNKPYSEKQRLDFIVTNNHNKGYELKETETALEAWGLTEEEQAEEAKNIRRAELISQLDEIDLKTIRPMRAKEAGVATDADLAKLQELEEQAAQIRAELQNL